MKKRPAETAVLSAAGVVALFGPFIGVDDPEEIRFAVAVVGFVGFVVSWFVDRRKKEARA